MGFGFNRFLGSACPARHGVPGVYVRSRRAFDADHIAAIDNVVRKLMQEGQTPYSVGFFFSLGHSTVVVLASIAIAATAVALQTSLMPSATLAALLAQWCLRYSCSGSASLIFSS